MKYPGIVVIIVIAIIFWIAVIGRPLFDNLEIKKIKYERFIKGKTIPIQYIHNGVELLPIAQEMLNY